jgi:mono/diheme cytochrome c family protein
MIRGRMPRPLKLIALLGGLGLVSLGSAACGTERVSVPRADAAVYHGAVLFSQRCAGCHTLSYAGTHGSAANVRDRQAINGPNFNVRCERPILRVLYAIENGGFSGAYMPQNVVVGQDARDVAEFVSRYAGHQQVTQPGSEPCVKQPIGTLPASGAAAYASIVHGDTTGTGSSTTAASSQQATSPSPPTTPTTASSTTTPTQSENGSHHARTKGTKIAQFPLSSGKKKKR